MYGHWIIDVMEKISQPKHPWCKKSCGQESKKAMLKKMGNQNRRPRPSGIDGVKIFDNDDQAAKHYYYLLTVKL